jgi:hypothetical protein
VVAHWSLLVDDQGAVSTHMSVGCEPLVSSQATALKAEHACLLSRASRSLIDPDIIHQQRLGKRRAGIGTSSPLSPDGDVENEKERMVEHPP